MVSYAEAEEKLRSRVGRYLFQETAYPKGQLKADYISIREADGRSLLAPIPSEVLDRLMRDGIVRLEGEYNQLDNRIYRPVTRSPL